MQSYAVQFKNLQLLTAALLMGSGTTIIYSFAALAPFVAINLLHLQPAIYGFANLMPPVGLILGSFVSGEMTNHYQQTTIIYLGIFMNLLGSVMMLIMAMMHQNALMTLFVPMSICYFGLSCIFGNASTCALRNTADKAHGAAVMSFMNMGSATLIVLLLGTLSISLMLLPVTFILLSVFMLCLNMKITKSDNQIAAKIGA
jgi:MFS transporter, DHA1 family, multidrug resistance protein